MKTWLALLLGVLLLVFTAQNTQVVEVRLLFWKVEMSRAIMLLVVLATGVVVGLLLPGVRRGRARRT